MKGKDIVRPIGSDDFIHIHDIADDQDSFEDLHTLTSNSNIAEYCDAYYIHEITARNTYISTFFWSQLKISTLLGVGAFGNVRKGENALPGVPKDVVVKELCSAKILKGKADRFLLDIERSAGYIHPNVAHVYGATFYGPLALVMEYFPLGDLKSYMKNRLPNGGGCTIQEKHSFAFQIANGMNYLHKAECIHRNLSCANVMVSEPISNTFGLPCLKIADASLNGAENSLLRNVGRKSDLSLTLDVFLKDTSSPIFTRRLSTESWDSFGMSLRIFQYDGGQGIVKLDIHNEGDTETDNGTDRVSIIPPEVIVGGEYTQKSDVWSYGLLLWDILTDGQTNVVTAGEPLELQSNFATLLKLLCKCLSSDQELRSDFFRIASNTAFEYLAVSDEPILKYDLHNQVHLQRDKAYIPRSLMKISAKACAAEMTVRPPSIVVLNSSTRDHSGDIPIVISPDNKQSEQDYMEHKKGRSGRGQRPCLSRRSRYILLGGFALTVCLVIVATAVALIVQPEKSISTSAQSSGNTSEAIQFEMSSTSSIGWDPPATVLSSLPIPTETIPPDFAKTFTIRTLNESVFDVDLRNAACFNGVQFDSCDESASVPFRWVDFNLLAPNTAPTRCITQQNYNSAGCLDERQTTDCNSYVGTTPEGVGFGCDDARERFIVQKMEDTSDSAGVRLFDDVSEQCVVYTTGLGIGLDLGDCSSSSVATLVLDSF